MPNDQPKWIATSKTAWGLVVVLLGTFLGADLTSEINDLGTAILDLLPQIVAIVGTAIALYGRIVATQKATLLPPSKN